MNIIVKFTNINDPSISLSPVPAELPSQSHPGIPGDHSRKPKGLQTQSSFCVTF